MTLLWFRSPTLPETLMCSEVALLEGVWIMEVSYLSVIFDELIGERAVRNWGLDRGGDQCGLIWKDYSYF